MKVGALFEFKFPSGPKKSRQGELIHVIKLLTLAVLALALVIAVVVGGPAVLNVISGLLQ